MIEASRGNRVFGWRVQQHPPAAPRGERELIAVIAVTPETEEVPKSLKTWSGRRDSNPRRPAWEAGILPLNYSRKLVFSATCLKAKTLEPFRSSLLSLCCPSVSTCSDREMDSITDRTESMPTVCAAPLRSITPQYTRGVCRPNGSRSAAADRLFA